MNSYEITYMDGSVECIDDVRHLADNGLFFDFRDGGNLLLSVNKTVVYSIRNITMESTEVPNDVSELV